MKSTTIRKGIYTVFFLCLSSIVWMGCDSKKHNEDSPPATANEVTAAETIPVDSEAVELLRRGLGVVAGLDQFSVQTQGTYEDVLNDTYRVDYETSSSLSVDRPDKIRIERYGLKMHQVFYFDGGNFTLHNPYDYVYATELLQGEIEDMFHIARDNFGISGPASDLIYKNSFSLLIEDVNGAAVIGKEMIGDVMCDHLLFTRPDVSFQIWISESAPHLPYKYVVTDITTPQRLSYSIVMKNWNTAAKLNKSMFKFIPPKGSKQIQFLKVDPNTEQ